MFYKVKFEKLQSSRGDYQSPVVLWFSEEPSSNLVGAHPCVRPLCSRQTVPFIDITVQTCKFAPLRGRSFLASPRKEPKKATWGRRSDCAVVTLLRFGTTPGSPNSPSPKTPSAQGISSTNQIENLGSHLPRCA